MIKEEEFLINLSEVRRKIEIACTKEGGNPVKSTFYLLRKIGRSMRFAIVRIP